MSLKRHILILKKNTAFVSMEKDKVTRNNLIQSARKELAENGYLKGFLETVCKNVVLLRGFVFLFLDKNDLFDEVVGGTKNEIYNMMEEHFEDEKCILVLTRSQGILKGI